MMDFRENMKKNLERYKAMKRLNDSIHRKIISMFLFKN